MENSSNNAVSIVRDIDDDIARVRNQLPDGNRRAEKLQMIKDAINSHKGNQLAEKFDSIKIVINQTVSQLLTEADEKIFENNYNLILSLLSANDGADMAMADTANNPSPSMLRPEWHVNHPDHKLKWKTSKDSYFCNGCKMHGFGPRYSCELCEGRSKFNLHPVCMTSSPTSPATRHELLASTTFKFLYKRPGSRKNASCTEICRRCEACAQPTKGYVYYEEGKENDRGINFHPCCFKVPSKLVDEEGIEYELCQDWTSKKKCRLCKKIQPKDSVMGNMGWSYESKSCKKYKIDVFCMLKMSLKKGQDGDLSVVMKDTREPIEKRGIKLSKKLISIVKVLLSILLGDPIGLVFNVAEALGLF